MRQRYIIIIITFAPAFADARARDARMEDHLVRFKRVVVPRLDARCYKGSHGGKIAVVGGSATYSGAPFYAAMGAARAGADLVRVFTSTACAPVVKAYSPDVIVHAAWEDVPNEESASLVNPVAVEWLRRVDALVLGPGLGGPGTTTRGDFSRDCVNEWRGWIESDVPEMFPVVFDADGLKAFDSATWDEEVTRMRYSERHPPQGFWWDIGTPNKMELFRLIEWGRLCETKVDKKRPREDVDARRRLRVEDVNVDDESFREEVIGKALEQFAPVNFLLKGDTDWLFINRGNGSENGEFIPIGDDALFRGAPKRCGGQGDILAGVLATFLAWAHRRSSDPRRFDPSVSLDEPTARALFIAAVVAACYVTRGAVARGFDDVGRGLQASDVLKYIPEVFAHKFERL